MNGFTNYSFTSGWLKRVSVGANATWQARPANGFGVQNIGGSFVPNPAVIFYGSDLLRLGANISYQRKVWNERVNWRVQVNVQDIGGVDPYTIRKSAAGSAPSTPVTTYWHKGYPQTSVLTNTFEF